MEEEDLDAVLLNRMAGSIERLCDLIERLRARPEFLYDQDLDEVLAAYRGASQDLKRGLRESGRLS